jgi:uncharacterized RDD family membrane protein YckC
MPVPAAPRYARFTRRLRGIVIDWIVGVTLLFGAVFAVASVRSDGFSHALGVMIVLVLVLYEPVLVSRAGGTLGHYFSNLRVVDERSGGNVSFARALGRFALKSLLGWYSFLVMAATRRNQAVHDLMTRTTVQIRDPARARPHHYIVERDFEGATMPSRLRRAGVTALGLLMVFLVFVLGLAVATYTGAVSEACLNDDVCRSSENFQIIAWSGIWLAASALCIVLGWTGRLPGARRQPQISYPPSARQ